jgi:transcriptional activator TraM
MKDDALDLIREIAAEHGVALDRNDPVLILQTATRKILQDALVQSQRAISEALAQHRSELELAASKWQADSQRVATQLVRETRAAIAASVGEELNQQVSGATARLRETVASHETALARSNLVCALTAAIVVLASAIIVLSN